MSNLDNSLRGIAMSANAMFAVAEVPLKFLSAGMPMIEIQWLRYVPLLGVAATLAPGHDRRLPVFDNLPDRWTPPGAPIIIASGCTRRFGSAPGAGTRPGDRLSGVSATFIRD